MIDSRQVLVSGSSLLSPALVPFVKDLGKNIILQTDFQIITGGLLEREKDVPTTDYSVVLGAKEGLKQIGCDPQERIITMLPQQSDNFVFPRFKIGKVIEVHKSNLKSRRYSMVLSSDFVLTVAGASGTKEIIDLSWIAGKPTLPIPATSDISKERWDKYRCEIVSNFNLSTDEINILEATPIETDLLVNTCISLLRRTLKPRCFIAMKFSNHPLVNCYGIICRVVEEKGYIPIRVDQASFSGSIIDAIWGAIRGSEIVIADITDGNPNVFYEVGISHALGKQTVLTIFDKYGRVPSDIPFDIKVLRILPYETESSLISQLEKHLPAAHLKHNIRLDPTGNSPGAVLH